MKKMFVIVILLGSLLLSACTFTLSMDGKEVGSIDPCQVQGVTSKLCEDAADAKDATVPEEDKVTTDVPEATPTVDLSNDNPDYFPEYSCSDLESCPVKVVPQNIIVIGFPKGCQTYTLFLHGQTINYSGLSEIHAYDAGVLNLRVTLDSFVDSQKSSILACLP